MGSLAFSRFRTGTIPSLADAAAASAGSRDIALPPVPVAAPPTINRAALRASDARARIAAPGLETAIDFAKVPTEGPTDMGTYVSPSQQEENRGIAARHAFEGSPEWKGVGGGLRSAAQMYQDLEARDLLNEEYKQGVRQTNLEDAVRGDPLSLATAARRKMADYEDSLPADAQSFIRYGSGGGMRDYAGQRESAIGTPSIGEYRMNRSLLAQAAAKQNPKDVAEGATTMGRGRLAEELAILRDSLNEQVSKGTIKPEEAASRWNTALQQAQGLAEILKGGFPRQDALTP